MPPALEPICAIITPAGFAAIAVLRISGEAAIDLVSRYFRPADRLRNAPSHRVLHGYFMDRAGEEIDEVLLTVFRAPKSYTGEDSVEISCHGNPDLTNRILQQLLAIMRLAQPGEFTLRAYLNGKLDLNQAEAVNDLIHARAKHAEKAALNQLQGRLSQELQTVMSRISEARLRCELAIDFSDQDLPLPDLDMLHSLIGGILDSARKLAATGEQGKLVREGIKVCLSGAPNVGKSSLFNAFLQQNRALVTPHPGTTRDYLEESISLEGFPVVLFDTAGLRGSKDEVEALGIAKSRELMQSADLILYLHDYSSLAGEHHAISMEEPLRDKVLLVAAKSDLLPAGFVLPLGVTPCSSVSPDGLERLSQAILQRLKLNDYRDDQSHITNTRQLAALERCINYLEGALNNLENSLGFEFIAFELQSASSALEELLGVITPDDLLTEIFSNFCIGK